MKVDFHDAKPDLRHAKLRLASGKGRSVRPIAAGIWGRAIGEDNLLLRLEASQHNPYQTLPTPPAKMAQVISQSGHDDMIHDAVLDYYGRRLATCSSDKTIQIFDVDGDQHRLTETLKGYTMFRLQINSTTN